MDSCIYKIYLPFPGVPKERPRASRSGVFYTPSKTRQYEANASQLMKQQFIFQPLDCPIEAWVTFVFAKPKTTKFKDYPSGSFDLDNLCKSVFDAANSILWVDDSRIVKQHSEKVWASDGIAPGVRLEFRSLGPSTKPKDHSHKA